MSRLKGSLVPNHIFSSTIESHLSDYSLTSKTVPNLQGLVRPLGPYSHAVLANGFVFVSGQSGLKPGQQSADLARSTVTDQTKQCLRNVESVLKALGGSLSDVVKVTVFLANPSDFKPMNDAYREYFPEEPPARSISRLGADVPNMLVSIDAIAVHSAGNHASRTVG